MPNYKYKRVRVNDSNIPESDVTTKFNTTKFLGICSFLVFLFMLLFISAYKQTDLELVALTTEIDESIEVCITTPKVNRSVPPLPTPQYGTKNTTSKYFVYSPYCQMPYVPPFAAEVLKYFKPSKPAKCAQDEALVASIYDSNRHQYILYMKPNATGKYANASNSIQLSDAVFCCYREIVRSGSGKYADKRYKLLPCSNFHNDFIVPKHIDAMIVECSSSTTKKLIQKDAISFIQIKNDTIYAKKNARGVERKPGVLLIGIDSLSRMNFRRNMPNTLSYLEKNNWFELQGYNKIGDNTYPNLMALLAGYNETTAYKGCKPKFVNGLDNCQLIWKSFKNASYRTAYAEDTASISTFNYLKVGFQKPPTDYYLRPMLLATEATLKVTKKAGLPFCIGRKQYGEYVLDFALEFARRYRDDPIFGLFWMNSFSHNQFDLSSSMDEKMFEYFKSFEDEGILERSIVIFFSDHGMRFGKLRKLSGGFLEERLPMFFVSLPKWFQTQYPQFVRALEANRNRLTSPYDIHMTLNNILELYEPGAKLPAARGCATCHSIFREVPENRTCSHAGIPEHWCTCVPYETASANSATTKNVANLVIDEMNKYLDVKGFRERCKKHKLKTVEKAELRVEGNIEEPHNSTYRIRFVTTPGDASFQGTAIFNARAKSVTIDVEDISRLNQYAETAACVQDNELKKYCIC